MKKFQRAWVLGLLLSFSSGTSVGHAAIVTSGELSTAYDETDPWQTTYLIVGVGNPGSISVDAGSRVINSHDTTVGSAPGASTSSVVINGYGSSWFNSGGMIVGDYGSGMLEITDGATLTGTQGAIGHEAGGEGIVNVSGGMGTHSSSWGCSFLQVGAWGSGTLNISNGGRVSTANTRIASDPGSTGTMTVTGVGSSLTCRDTSDLTVGFDGTGTLTISDGGSVSDYTATIGFGRAGEVTVGGGTNTARWANGSTLTVGSSAIGTLNINTGGSVSATALNGGVSSWSTGSSVNLDGGVLSITATDDASNQINLGSAGGTIDVPTTNSTFSVTSSINGTGVLTKSGSATLALSGANTYSGNTLVSGGTLKLTGSGSLSTSPLLDIEGGAKFDVATINGGANYDGTHFLLASGQTLKGTGTVVGATTIGAGSTLAPGDSIGILTTGSISMASGGTLAIELAGTSPGVSYDRLIVSGTLSLGGTLNVETVDGFTPVLGDSFDVINWGTVNGKFAQVNLPPLATGLMWNDLRFYKNGSLTVTLSGDFNADGAVDAADYVLLRKTGGTEQQYDLWRSNFGAIGSNVSGASANAAIAEPGSAFLLLLAGVSVLTSRHAVRS